jgi:TetR/AcrR family transcriptional regulator, transcriptional repressor of bet genes
MVWWAEIVAATPTVIAANGYERATIQQIAKQAGLAPGLIHYHFHDKRAFQLSSVARKVMPRGHAAESAFILIDRFVQAEPAV